MRKWIAALLMGAATGSRSQTGLAALVLSTPAGATGQPDRAFATRGAKIAITVAALGELVGDKLPNTPSRLGAPGLGARIAVAAVGGVVIARRGPLTAPRTAVALSAAAATTAVVTAWLGARWRSRASPPHDSPLLAALIEDVTAITLAAGAAVAAGV